MDVLSSSATKNLNMFLIVILTPISMIALIWKTPGKREEKTGQFRVLYSEHKSPPLIFDFFYKRGAVATAGCSNPEGL